VICLGADDNNLRRLVTIPVGTTVTAIRFCGTAVHAGGSEIRLFSFEIK